MKFLLLICVSFVFAIDQSNFQSLLNSSVSQSSFKYRGKSFTHSSVNYKALLTPKSKEAIAAQQKAYEQATLPTKRNEKLAFWINAYNFFTFVDVAANYPVASMKDIGWKKEHHVIAGKKYSLDQMEHKVLRPMGDARIHFAINCASVGCPAISSKVYKAKAVKSQLKKATANSLKNPMHFRPGKIGLFSSSDGYRATKLFSWFSKDFGNLKSFVEKNSSWKVGEADISTNLDYNWNLNSPKNIKAFFTKLKKELPELK